MEFTKYYKYIHEYMLDIKTLIEKIKKDQRSKNTKYEYIYAIPRGGLIIGVYLSHALDLKLISDLVAIEFIDKEKILIVDDLVDTGKTLEEFLGYNHAVLYKKPRSIVNPKYFVEEFPDEVWIVFPYEKGNETPNREL